MRAKSSTILVHPIAALESDRRRADRLHCRLDATVHTHESLVALSWGAAVRDISRTGIGLTLCFPFPVGTYLALDLQARRSDHSVTPVYSRVAYCRDKNDGSWYVGCEFMRSLTKTEFNDLP